MAEDEARREASKMARMKINLPRVASFETIHEEQMRIKQLLRGGHDAVCRCCGDRLEVRAQPLTEEMLTFLHKLAVAYKGEPLHVRRFSKAGVKASNDGAYLKQWGLVRVTRPGLYSVTNEGYRFVHGDSAIPETALSYKNKVVGFAGPMVTYDAKTGTVSEASDNTSSIFIVHDGLVGARSYPVQY
jgi:hypothetical protein